MMQRRVIFILAGIFFILLGIFAISATLPTIKTDVVSTGALFGGDDERGYQQAGYIVTSYGNTPVAFCGATIIDSQTVVTAAHCVDDEENSVTFGTGDFSINKGLKLDSSQITVHKRWDGVASANDIATLSFPNANLTPSSTIFVPTVGCDYKIIAYGRTEKESTQDALSLYRERKSSQLCVTLVEKDVFYVQGVNSGVCTGDSGSPIFESNSDHVVGFISAILSKKDSDPCYIGNTGVAVRLDTKQIFVATGSSDILTAATTTQAPQQADTAQGQFSVFSVFPEASRTEILLYAIIGASLFIVGIIVARGFFAIKPITPHDSNREISQPS